MSGGGGRYDPCLFCHKDFQDLPGHLDMIHKEECFQCGVCYPETQSFHFYNDILTHLSDIHGVGGPVFNRDILLPTSLEQITCSFCSPAKIFMGKPVEELMMCVYEHLTTHESVHKGNEEVIDRVMSYECRICVNGTMDLAELQEHTSSHYRLTWKMIIIFLLANADFMNGLVCLSVCLTCQKAKP